MLKLPTQQAQLVRCNLLLTRNSSSSANSLHKTSAYCVMKLKTTNRDSKNFTDSWSCSTAPSCDSGIRCSTQMISLAQISVKILTTWRHDLTILISLVWMTPWVNFKLIPIKFCFFHRDGQWLRKIILVRHFTSATLNQSTHGTSFLKEWRSIWLDLLIFK